MKALSHDLPFIRSKGGQLFTTSIDVAEKFGKRHDRVLRAIRTIIKDSNDPNFGEVDFSSRNFVETSNLD